MERDKKRKESETYIDTSGLENAKLQTESYEEMVTAKKWMTEAMQQLKDRTDDVSEVEQFLSQEMDMESMNGKLSKVADAITKMSEDNNSETRDSKNSLKASALD